MIGCKSKFHSVRCDLAWAKERSSIIDEHVNTRFRSRDFGCNPLYVSQTREIRVMDGVVDAR
jgi:hypothetical protein